jgi:hypothetical protein
MITTSPPPARDFPPGAHAQLRESVLVSLDDQVPARRTGRAGSSDRTARWHRTAAPLATAAAVLAVAVVGGVGAVALAEAGGEGADDSPGTAPAATAPPAVAVTVSPAPSRSGQPETSGALPLTVVVVEQQPIDGLTADQALAQAKQCLAVIGIGSPYDPATARLRAVVADGPGGERTALVTAVGATAVCTGPAGGGPFTNGSFTGLTAAGPADRPLVVDLPDLVMAGRVGPGVTDVRIVGPTGVSQDVPVQDGAWLTTIRSDVAPTGTLGRVTVQARAADGTVLAQQHPYG